ncbi:hypothetical protein TTHERM_000188503 (macronuclear) [Tetrahymena thermophila SB210]|uniref:WD domain, G-beta repeat protein n=1 Tax=Tetrahymena thermophila (strain SB210) TaxID=312017 RepID=W7XA63_TETTS|nr:hypothetical protein TTHERM_000188503 [Tetrahymena thermophila SB210]EWS74227.1 hypothetical protein TTHERM_000188503 [Tetrahymena thermophila SB210]|eukprot:XP_012653200.1 hypothetical protein TTHERM_000188503 [Tetrahymena thermophila SB210]
MIISISVTSTFLIILLQVVKIQAVGCPFRLDGCTNQDLRVKQILLLKSNPQSDDQDIAAVVYDPFTVGIFNFEINNNSKLLSSRKMLSSTKLIRMTGLNYKHPLFILWMRMVEQQNGIQVMDLNKMQYKYQILLQYNLIRVLILKKCQCQHGIIQRFILSISLNNRTSRNNNLFTIWEIKSQKIIYIPDFQKIYCDQRDSNNTKVDEVINFKFGSINEKDEIAVVSDSYIFVYSILQKKPIIFKSQNLGLSWIQAFVVQNSVILSQTYSVSSIDKRTSRINYLMNYFSNGQSIYDIPVQLEVDNELNRVIYSDFKGNLQIWSQINNQQEQFISKYGQSLLFIIDKQLNKMVLYTNATIQTNIYIYDYQEIKLLDTLSFPYQNTQLLDIFQLYQDKTNGYLLGFDQGNTNYAIYRFTSESSYPILYSCTLIKNGIITNSNIYLLEQSKQFLVQIARVLYLFSYLPENGNQLTSFIIAGQNVQFSFFQYIESVQTLICVQETYIQIYYYSSGQFNLQNLINYYSGQSNSIFLAEAQNTLIIQRTSQLFFKNYLTQNDQMINFNNLQILYYQYDASKALLICLDSSFTITVIDLVAIKSLYHIQIEENKIAIFNIQEDTNFIIISYYNGQILIYDYQANVIVSTYNNYQPSLLFKFDKSNNNLILQSQLEISSKRLTNLGLISQINNDSLQYFWVDEMTGLTFILTDQIIIIYNPFSQEYLPQFSVDFDFSFIYALYYIPQLDFLFIAYCDYQVNQVFAYKLSSQTRIATMDHNIKHCYYVSTLYYDSYSQRLFSGCAYPASIIVWDLNNFQMIKLLDKILQASVVESIKFYPQKQIILMSGYNWWGVTVDYYTLQERCQVMGIFGEFDYSHNLQILWDQNGDYRIFDLNCYQIAFQHAHTGWIQQLLIDESNMYLTTLGFDQYVKLWNYQNITQPILISQRFLTYSLTYGLLDNDNNLVLVVDFQGFIYILSYPDLNLLKAIQATFAQIDMIYLIKPFNLIAIGSYESYCFSFYNLFELISPNQNELYFRYEGILSTLMTDQGVIFHQLGNIVQSWNYSTQQLIYGFFVNSQFESFEAESRFLSLSRYQNLAALFTRDQTIFFNTNTLDIINVQQLKCMNSIQIQIFLICALTNKLTVFSLDSFSIYQQIVLNPNQSIISLQQIFQTDSFFAITTQGEIVCYLIQSNQFLNKFQTKILNQAIANYQQIQQNEFYIILASAFDGSFGYIQISIDLNTINKFDFNLPGQSSHAHKIIYFNNNLFIKRISDYYLGLYNINTMNQITQIKSPCVGYTYKLDFSQDYDLILQSCVGNYRINQLSTFQDIVYVLYSISKITKVQLPIQGDNSCKEILSYNQISEVLLSIQDVYQQISNYFKIEDMVFTLIVDKYTYLQPLSPFTFSQITQLSIMSDPDQNTKKLQHIIIKI